MKAFAPALAALSLTSSLASAAPAAPAGAPGTVYPTGYPFRGLSTLPPSVFSILGNTLTFNFQTIVPSNFVDQVRVITHTAPAPGSAALLGLAGVACARRR